MKKFTALIPISSFLTPVMTLTFELQPNAHGQSGAVGTISIGHPVTRNGT
ncbi:MAG: hypothetical protein WC847_01555 [Candidatus Paceibacterota bacterium]|jgi:hypothetical protein